MDKTGYVRVQAMIGMGLTPLAFRRKCAEYIGSLSAARRAAAADHFGGTIIKVVCDVVPPVPP